MFTTLFWLVVIGIAQAIGFGWISSKHQRRSYNREIRSRHSYVLLAILLAEEEHLRCSCDCRGDGTGKAYLALPQGIVKVFSRGSDGFAISLVNALVIDDMHADAARELCKDLNARETRVRYSVGFEPLLSKTSFSITCDLEEDADDETTEYNIIVYTKAYLVPKQQELQTIWTQKMEEMQ